MTVTFIGHHDAPNTLQKDICNTIEDLILHEGADTFYVGNHGNFDRMVTIALRGAHSKYSHIKCYIVLSRMPLDQSFVLETIFPQEVAVAHYKSAIFKRNMWMLEQSDTLLSYVCCSYGGASQVQKRAILTGKRVISLRTIKTQ